jgi:hypothetical protein
MKLQLYHFRSSFGSIELLLPLQFKMRYLGVRSASDLGQTTLVNYFL